MGEIYDDAGELTDAAIIRILETEKRGAQLALEVALAKIEKLDGLVAAQLALKGNSPMENTKISDLIDVLNIQDPSLEVQFMVIANSGQVITMNLSGDIVDLAALFRSFRK